MVRDGTQTPNIIASFANACMPNKTSAQGCSRILLRRAQWSIDNGIAKCDQTGTPVKK